MIFQGSSTLSGVVRSFGFLKVRDFLLGRSGDIGGHRFLEVAGAEQLLGLAGCDDEIGYQIVCLKLVRLSTVEMSELHRFVKRFGAGRRERGEFRIFAANSLATDVEIPRQALSWLTTDDLVQRIVFVFCHRDSDLNSPVVVVDLRRDFGLRVPTEPLCFLCRSVDVDDGSRRVDGDLVIVVRIGVDQKLDNVSIPDSLITVLSGGDVWFAAGLLFATHGEVHAALLPD